MKNPISFALAVLCLILAWSTFQSRQQLAELENRPSVVAQPDTVYVDKPYEVKVVEYRDRAVPVQVKVYPPDTLLRDTLERQDIITQVRLTKRVLTIDRIDPKGITFSEQYSLPEQLHKLHSIRIDHLGQVEVKPRKKHRVLKAGLVLIGAGATAYLILK